MNWEIEILSKDVEKELDSLDRTFQAKLSHIAALLREFGPDKVREPYCKPLGNKLWEIRMRAKPGIARAIYVTVKKRRIIILHAFVKRTDKTPKKAIDLAIRRLKEIKDD